MCLQYKNGIEIYSLKHFYISLTVKDIMLRKGKTKHMQAVNIQVKCHNVQTLSNNEH